MKCSTRLVSFLLALILGVSVVHGVTSRDEDAVAIGDPALDLVRIEWLRMGEHAGCVVHFLDAPQPDRVRILIDVDGPDRGAAPEGADFMVEGQRFYRHAGEDDAWTWDAIGEALVMEEDRALRVLLPKFEHGSTFRWYVESLKADFSVADRYPSDGLADMRWESLSDGVARPGATATDLRGLLEHSPLTLSFRWDTELKAVIWTAAPSPVAFAWQPESATSSIPFIMTVEDIADGSIVTATVASCATVSNATRWGGAVGGLQWTLVGESRGDGLQLTGQLQSPAERRVRASITLVVPEDLWSDFSDDDEIARLLDARNVESGFPLGIVGGSGGALTMENDVEEPRRFRIAAGSDSSRTLSISYDLGLTEATSNFPGRATFRCHVRYLAAGEGPSHRGALAAFYTRHPALSQRRVPRAGCWAFGESPPAGDLDAAFVEVSDGGTGDAKRLRFDAMSPWSHGQIIPAGFPCDEETALRLVKWAALGGGRSGELAISALRGVSRDAAGQAEMVLHTNPGCVAGWAVAVDPDLAVASGLPVTRAMTEWKLVDGLVGKTCDGVLLRAGWVWENLNHDAAALSVADYPCASEENDAHPGLAGEVSAMELLVPLAGAVRARGGFVAGEIPGVSGAGLIPSLDVIMGQPVKPDDRVGALLRVLAADKPVVLPVDLAGVSLKDTEAILSRLLYWGYLPALASAGDESVHAMLSSYLPVMSRAAEAGWNPVPGMRVRAEDLSIETFGRAGIRHVAIRNDRDGWAELEVSFEPVKEFTFWVNPFDASMTVLEPGATSLAFRAKSGISPRDWVPVSEVAGELEFLRNWGTSEGGAVHRSLSSAVKEVKRGLVCDLVCPEPAVRGETNVAVLTISNRSSEPVGFSDLKVISSKQFLPFDEAVASIAPGETAHFEAAFREEDMGDGPWLEVQWTLDCGGDRLDGVRMMRPDFVDPLVLSTASTNVVLEALEGELVLEVRSHSALERMVRVHWDGDFKGGDRTVVVEAGSRSVVRLPVKMARRRSGQMRVRASVDGEPVFDELFHVSFGEEVP